MNQDNILFYNANIFYNGKFENGELYIKNGKILSVITKSTKNQVIADKKIDMKGLYLLPGFIDIHTHGGFGYEFINAASDMTVLNKLCNYYASTGTTSVIAGTYTVNYKKIKQSLKNISIYMKEQHNKIEGSEICGINLEGPFINKEKCGAQNPDFIKKIDFKEIDELIKLSNNNIKLITIAPELEGGLDIIKQLVDKGITVSIGHTAADYSTALQAADNGALLITHFFNCLNHLNHKEPGVVGAGLVREDLSIELICDGYHVHPDLIKLLIKIKGSDKICFITDSVHPAGCCDGEYTLGGLDIIKKNDKITLKDGGNLAGSCLKMIDAFKNVAKFTGLKLEDIIPSFTSTPAYIVKVDDKKGTLDKGKDADFIILDNDLNLKYTYVKGIEVYRQ